MLSFLLLLLLFLLWLLMLLVLPLPVLMSLLLLTSPSLVLVFAVIHVAVAFGRGVVMVVVVVDGSRHVSRVNLEAERGFRVRCEACGAWRSRCMGDVRSRGCCGAVAAAATTAFHLVLG